VEAGRVAVDRRRHRLHVDQRDAARGRRRDPRDRRGSSTRCAPICSACAIRRPAFR
jgi:hypothetical protein